MSLKSGLKALDDDRPEANPHDDDEAGSNTEFDGQYTSQRKRATMTTVEH